MIGLYIALGVLGFILLFIILAVITMYRLIFFSPRKGQISDSTLVGSKTFNNYSKENVFLYIDMNMRIFILCAVMYRMRRTN